MLPIYEETTDAVEIHDQKSSHFPPHLHHSFELVFVTKGALAIGVGQELYPMEVGDFAVVFPNLIHHYQVFAPGENTACHILASPALGEDLLPEPGTLCPAVPVLPKASLHPEIPETVERLRSLAKEDLEEKFRSTLAASYVRILLVRAIPAFTWMEKTAVESDDVIYRTVAYISEHFKESVTLGGMAHDLGMSPYALSRVFSGTFHRNFNRYLNETRLDYAEALLRRTKQSVTEVAMNSGFESERTFHRVFRERYHCSPREYRRNC